MASLGGFRCILAVGLVSGCAPAAAPLGLERAPAVGATARPAMIVRHQRHRVFRHLHLTSQSGDCLTLQDSFDITVEASTIGPCGGNGISVAGGGDIRIYDSYIHPETLSRGCCDNDDGIFVRDARNVTIRGNVIAYGESNVESQASASVEVAGNFLLNPRGPFPRGQNVAAWHSNDITVRDNYTLSSIDTKRYLYPGDQEDSINFGKGDRLVAEGNYVTGGQSPSGCGILADDGADDVAFVRNRIVDSGECGIGIASGRNGRVANNRVINRNPVRGGGNTALYVWNQYKTPCGPETIAENVATEVRRDGTQSGFWNGGGCEPVRLRANTWNQSAQHRLTPVREKLPAPPIPPRPMHCVVASPYSTNERLPRCSPV